MEQARLTRHSDASLRKENALQLLAKEISQGKRVTFVTGAGISVASGIAPFRGSEDAVWSKSIVEWGTKKKFKEDPKAWYNNFFKQHFPEEKLRLKMPNATHKIIALLCTKFPNLKVITQNIDRLHCHESSYISPEQLIEVHGALGRYKCFTEGCIYSDTLTLKPRVHKRKREDELPSCPQCSSPMCCNTLLFDENYKDHACYRFDEAHDWLERSDIIVFVGTSFSVSITDIALDVVKEDNNDYRKLVFNFNINDNLPKYKSNFVQCLPVLGKCEESLENLLRHFQFSA